MKGRRSLRDAIRNASPDVKIRIRTLLEEYGMYDARAGVDILKLPDEIIAVVYTLAHGGKAYLPTPDLMTQRLAFAARVPNVAEIRWLARRHDGVLTPQLEETLKRCKRNGWSVVKPCYIRPAVHHGVDIGLGLFSLIRMQRGHMICQFTGRAHRIHGRNEREKKTNRTAWYNASQGRLDYAIEVKHGVHDYFINPLDSADRFPLSHNHAAYINEPSPPPWRPGDVVRVRKASRNAVVRTLHHETGRYTVEYADGQRVTVAASDLMDHALRDVQRAAVESSANCMWYDFPVPLPHLYEPTGTTRTADEQQVWMRRTRHTSCTLTFSEDELLKAYDMYSDGTGFFTLTASRIRKRLQTGHVLVLNDDVHRGLNRHGHVQAMSTRREVSVVHSVHDNTAWRLPRRILAANVGSEFVPFPTVHLCRDVAPNEELLCLYEKPDETRGAGCGIMDASDLALEWSDL